MNEKKTIEVGDILYFNAGYTMGIPTWIEITRLTQKRAYFKYLEMHSVRDDGYGQNGDAMPTLGAYRDSDCYRPEFGTVKECRGVQCVQIGHGSCAHHAFQWDGTPRSYYTD